jgi:ABC transport system ATP-binding/permease protein
MSIVVALFVGLIISAEEIFRDRKILKREKYLHLSNSSYLVSKITILFTLSAVQTIAFILVGNWLLEIPFGEMRYWLILFSCACFANMLGLNISSAFDSAVTIYILIPILIIPQLLLSGVVISFDKFNPKVGTPNGIPVLGEMMASRWAFEAYMVTQFKDNPYEKQFYPLDQKRAIADYKRLYYLPALESRLAYVVNHRNEWRNAKEESQTRKAMDLLRNEIKNELRYVGEERLPEVEKLQIGKFDSVAFRKTQQFLVTLKEYYGIRYKNAMTEKEKLMMSLTGSQEDKTKFAELNKKYQNESVINLVENSNNSVRIAEWQGELVQKIYPIYFEDHRPAHALDFRENFYVPSKYFWGKKYDTLYFNITIIWLMTALLYVTLYFESLKKLVHSFEMRRKYKQKK